MFLCWRFNRGGAIITVNMVVSYRILGWGEGGNEMHA